MGHKHLEPTWFPGDTPGFFGVLHTWGRQRSSYVFRTAISDHRIICVDDEHVLAKGFMHPSSSMPVKLAAALLEAMLAVPPERPKPIETSGIPPEDPTPVSGFT